MPGGRDQGKGWFQGEMDRWEHGGTISMIIRGPDCVALDGWYDLDLYCTDAIFPEGRGLQNDLHLFATMRFPRMRERSTSYFRWLNELANGRWVIAPELKLEEPKVGNCYYFRHEADSGILDLCDLFNCHRRGLAVGAEQYD